MTSHGSLFIPRSVRKKPLSSGACSSKSKPPAPVDPSVAGNTNNKTSDPTPFESSVKGNIIIETSEPVVVDRSVEAKGKKDSSDPAEDKDGDDSDCAFIKESIVHRSESDCFIVQEAADENERNDCFIVEDTPVEHGNEKCNLVSKSAVVNDDVILLKDEEEECVLEGKSSDYIDLTSGESTGKQDETRTRYVAHHAGRYFNANSPGVNSQSGTCVKQQHSDVSGTVLGQNPGTFYVNVGPLSPKKFIPLYSRRKRPPDDESFTAAATSYEKVRKMDEPQQRSEADPVPPQSSKQRRDKPPKEDRCCFPRQWEYTQLGLDISHSYGKKGLQFTVMSYNVLAQNLLEANMHLYPHCSSRVLNWDHRRDRLRDEIGYLKPDIICLQEVHKEHYDNFFRKFLKKEGYKGVYLKKSNDKYDGCATFFKNKKFSLDQSIPVYYNVRGGGSLLDRDNVALILKLKPRRECTSRRLVVSNTHILFNPRRGDIKLAQLMLLLAEMDKACFMSPNWPDVYHPLIMCGDYNLLPQSDIYRFLRVGYLDYIGLPVRTMSLQEETGWDMGRNSWEMDKDFFPSWLGINDGCKYKCEVLRQHTGKNQDDDNEAAADPQSLDESIVGSCGTGSLCHHLRLMSAYNHKLARYNFEEDEVSTHHNKAACTVDYIFYGVRSGLVCFDQYAGSCGEVKTKDVEEGPLKLLGRYGLLARHELAKMGSLPNKQFGSDHLCLIAKFVLE